MRNNAKRPGQHSPLPRSYRSENGAALITSIFALLLVTLLGMALVAVGEIGRSVSTNDRENTEALYLADSGITHARKLIFGFPSSNYSAILTAGDGVADTGDELSSTTMFASPIPAGGTTFAGGTYVVNVTDDNDETGPTQNRNVDRNMRIVVRSVGTARNGATATIEVIISATVVPAIVVDGNLRISGNPDLIGTGGGVHSNGNLEISGSPRAQDFFGASGTYSQSGSPKTGTPPGFSDSPPDTRAGATAVTIPNLNPADFRSQATYILGNDGRIRNQAGTVVGNASSGSWNDWSWDSGGRRWVAGNNIPAGTYYAEGGSINVSGNPGESGGPRALSFIADGYIEISGNPRMAPVSEYLMLAGTDLKISGNPDNPYTGTLYARHQIDFSGNPYINGQVLAKNLADTPYPDPGGNNPVPRQSGGFMVMSGNPVINFNGSGGSGATVASWREVRN